MWDLGGLGLLMYATDVHAVYMAETERDVYNSTFNTVAFPEMVHSSIIHKGNMIACMMIMNDRRPPPDI